MCITITLICLLFFGHRVYPLRIMSALYWDKVDLAAVLGWHKHLPLHSGATVSTAASLKPPPCNPTLDKL